LRFVVIGILFAFLAGAIYVGHYGWVSAGDVTMPAWGWLMMGLGIFFTLVIGGGLMILIFYSSRAGYDEAPQIEYDEGSHAETVAPESELSTHSPTLFEALNPFTFWAKAARLAWFPWLEAIRAVTLPPSGARPDLRWLA